MIEKVSLISVLVVNGSGEEETVLGVLHESNLLWWFGLRNRSSDVILLGPRSNYEIREEVGIRYTILRRWLHTLILYYKFLLQLLSSESERTL